MAVEAISKAVSHNVGAVMLNVVDTSHVHKTVNLCVEVSRGTVAIFRAVVRSLVGVDNLCNARYKWGEEAIVM